MSAFKNTNTKPSSASNMDTTYLNGLQERISLAEERFSIAQHSFDSLDTQLNMAETSLEQAESRLEILQGVFGKCGHKPQVVRDAERNCQQCKAELERTEFELLEAQVEYADAMQEVLNLESQIADYLQQNPPLRKLTPQELVSDWHQEMATAFADYSKIEKFPTPPVLNHCSSVAACGVETRTLKLCKCQIRHAFKHFKDLKTERLKWHPDRFAKCPVEVREELQRNAKEVFIVVDGMYREQQGRK